MAIPGTAAHEQGKQMLAALMEPKPLTLSRYDNPGGGKRPHRRPPRFSHLPPDVRDRAEQILTRLMLRHRDRLEQPNSQGLYGSLCAISSKLAQGGKNSWLDNMGVYGFKRRLMYTLGLLERPKKQQASQ